MTNIDSIGYCRSYVGKRAEMGVLDDACPQELLEHIEPPKKTKVTTGCPLCDKIWSSMEAYKQDIGSRWDEPQAIIMQDDEPWLYIPIDDCYYSNTYMQINFCPKCGRKLVEE